MNFANLRAKKNSSTDGVTHIKQQLESVFEYPFETFSRRGVGFILLCF